MRKRLIVLAGVIALASAVLAAGAQSRVLQDSPHGFAQSGTVTLSGWSVGKTEEDLLKEVIAAFERRYPNINVSYDAIPNYDQAMLAKFSARQPPDVFYLNSEKAPTWISQGLIAPLDSYIKRTKFKTKPFYPRLLNAFKVKGKIYGFPKDWSPLGMEINLDLLARSGRKAPTTWAQLRSLAQRLKPMMTGTARPICLAPEWQRMLAFVYQNKGSFLNASKTRATVNTAAVRQATEYYVGLIRQGLAGTPADLGVGWCGEALGKEKAAIVFEGNWVLPYMVEQFGTVRFSNHPMPMGKQRGNLAFTVSYSIAKDSKNKNAAWTLLTYLTGREGMRTWTSKGLALPSRRDVRPVAGRQPFVAAAPYARPWQFAPGFAKVMTVAGNELSAVFENKQTIPAMLAKIQSEAQTALRRGGR
jgi:multiple sugar transport system substrate-binding protein